MGRFSPTVLPYSGPRRPGVADALQEGLAAFAQMRAQQRDERNQMLQAGGVELPHEPGTLERVVNNGAHALWNRISGRTTLPATDAPDLQRANTYASGFTGTAPDLTPDLARAKNIPADVPQPFVPAAMETPPGGVRPGVGLPAGGAAMPSRGMASMLGGMLAPGGMNGGLRPTPGFNPNGGAVPGARPAMGQQPGVADVLRHDVGGPAPGMSPSGYVLQGRGGARYAFDPAAEQAAARAQALATLDAQEGVKNKYATQLETAKAAAAERARQEGFGQQKTLAEMHETAADRRARLAADATRGARNPMQSNRLLTAFDNDPSFKNAQQIAQSLSQLRAAAKDPSAAGDIAVLTHYMKMIDPTSSVREGEFANAQNAASIPDRIRNQYNKAVSGQRLNPQTRADFVRQAEALADSQRNVFKGTVTRYSTMAQRAGIDPRDVVFDPYTTLDEPARAPASAGGVDATAMKAEFDDAAAAAQHLVASGVPAAQVRAAYEAKVKQIAQKHGAMP